MKSTRRPNAMLIELVIVILFFALSAGIILQLFVAAHDRSAQNETDTAAMLMAEDFAERFAASRQPLDAFLEADGWAAQADARTKQVAREGATPLTLHLTGESEQAEAGTLDRLTLTIRDGGREAVTLPVSRYLPGEGTP